MLVQRAVFTSLRTGQNEGYQLAAVSPGVSADEARELARWGPGHDSIYAFARQVTGMHRMRRGTFCLTRTRGVGKEYSGRGGVRVYTWFFLVGDDVFDRFAFHPFRMLQALTAAGYTDVLEPTSPRLEPINLVGRASSIDVQNLERVTKQIGPLGLATLLNAAITTDRLGVTTEVRADRLLTALLDLLPPGHRRELSLTTGLRVSPRRPYRIHVLPPDPAEQRAATRRLPLTQISLLDDPSGEFAPQYGWPLRMYRFLKEHQFDTIAQIVHGLRGKPVDDLDCLAELTTVGK